ncbi:MAG: hypothetical protein LBT91_02175 [Bifidobacteriaceae bacterium]|jgi:hypothetical protein|nr:hypothetical protein [Bifidobacteriaceae bacterium]
MIYLSSILLALLILVLFWLPVPVVIYLTKAKTAPIKMAAILFSWLIKIFILYVFFIFIKPYLFYDKLTLIAFILAGSLVIFIFEIKHFKL